MTMTSVDSDGGLDPWLEQVEAAPRAVPCRCERRLVYLADGRWSCAYCGRVVPEEALSPSRRRTAATQLAQLMSDNASGDDPARDVGAGEGPGPGERPRGSGEQSLPPAVDGPGPDPAPESEEKASES